MLKARVLPTLCLQSWRPPWNKHLICFPDDEEAEPKDFSGVLEATELWVYEDSEIQQSFKARTFRPCCFRVSLSYSKVGRAKEGIPSNLVPVQCHSGNVSFQFWIMHTCKEQVMTSVSISSLFFKVSLQSNRYYCDIFVHMGIIFVLISLLLDLPCMINFFTLTAIQKSVPCLPKLIFGFLYIIMHITAISFLNFI